MLLHHRPRSPQPILYHTQLKTRLQPATNLRNVITTVVPCATSTFFMLARKRKFAGRNRPAAFRSGADLCPVIYSARRPQQSNCALVTLSRPRSAPCCMPVRHATGISPLRRPNSPTCRRRPLQPPTSRRDDGAGQFRSTSTSPLALADTALSARVGAQWPVGSRRSDRRGFSLFSASPRLYAGSGYLNVQRFHFSRICRSAQSDVLGIRRLVS